MKHLITYTFFFPFLANAQDNDKRCEEYFWRSIDTTQRDTITVFNDHSLCIKELPIEFYKMTQLQQILLDTETSLEVLSEDIKNFQNLEVLLIQKSKLRQIPKEIGQLKKLKRLTIAWGGQLEELPEEIGELENLEFLDLWRNELTTLPDSIENLKNLKVLRLGENKFSVEEREKIIELLPNCKIIFDY